MLLGTGCSPTLEVDSPIPDGAAAAQCTGLEAAAPATVAGEETREVVSQGVALAWGDPAITLRCGLPVPAAAAPGARCDTVENVDWVTTRTEDGYRFATIGRATTVELFVPFDYEPAADALVDVAAAVRETIPVVERCR